LDAQAIQPRKTSQSKKIKDLTAKKLRITSRLKLLGSIAAVAFRLPFFFFRLRLSPCKAFSHLLNRRQDHRIHTLELRANRLYFYQRFLLTSGAS